MYGFPFSWNQMFFNLLYDKIVTMWYNAVYFTDKMEDKMYIIVKFDID